MGKQQDGNGETKEKKNRASGTTTQLDLLVSVMKEYADAAKFRGQNGWKSMATRLNNQFPIANFVVDQLKFREQRLKKEYFIVKSTVEKSGFGFDPINKMLTTIPEKWDELSKEQQKWRYKAFPYYDDLHAIYDECLENNSNQFPTEDVNTLPDPPPMKKARTSKGNDEVKTKQIESYRDVKMALMEKKNPDKDPYCIANCIVKLKTMPDLSASEHLKTIEYLKGQRADREIFMTVEHDVVLEILKKVLGRQI
uniref:Myb/SANT-like domain-containing protein n=1 Tax=Aegilops tauschii TaxID=37682 RepID=M8AVN4_AEGTA